MSAPAATLEAPAAAPALEIPPAPRGTESALYEGTVRHRRFTPVEHEFSYRLYMAYLDLDELPGVLDPFPGWSARGRALTRFERSDFMGPAERPLAECARDEVEAATGERPEGPVRLLSGLRHFGHHFNPVSFYYLFGTDGETLEAVIADVKNIPWGERHPYVLSKGGQTPFRNGGDSGEGAAGPLEGEFAKVLHVSPLMGMGHRYSLRTSVPGERLAVHIESRPVGEGPGGEAKAFDATLSLSRHELTRASATRMLARYPLMSLKVIAGIYWQSLKLKRKGARYSPHPEGKKPKGFLSP